MYFFLITLLHSGCFAIEFNRKFSKVFICLVSESVFYVYFHCGDLSSFARKNFIFCGVAKVVFRVTSSAGVFRLSVSGKA